MALALVLGPLGTTPALADTVAYGSAPLTIRPPSGFVDSVSIADDLFRDTQSGLNGVLLKLYLPSADALLYEEKRRDSITRQVAIYGWPGSEKLTQDKKALELAAKTLEGAYAGYEVLPAEKLPELRKDDAQMQDAYRAVLAAGASMLIEINVDDQYITHSSLVNYSPTPPRPVTSPIFAPANQKMPPKGSVSPEPLPETVPHGLVTAISTTVVLVNDCIVFITASSLIPAPQPELLDEHVQWTTYASEAFADMLVSSNKK